MILTELSNQTLILYIAGFLRIGSCFLYMPAIGESTVSPMIRLILALMTTITIIPTIQDNLPIIKVLDSKAILLFGQELIIGLSIALTSRLFLSAIHVAGVTIGSMLGLSIAMLFDPSQQGQSNTVGLFLNVVITMLFLANNIHLIFIQAIADSYQVIGFADMKHYSSLISVVVQTIGKMWSIGLRIAGPFILINIVLMFGSGVLAKLMPQLQIFFVMVPVQILLGIIILLVGLSGITTWFVEQYVEFLQYLNSHK